MLRPASGAENTHGHKSRIMVVNTRIFLHLMPTGMHFLKPLAVLGQKRAVARLFAAFVSLPVEQASYNQLKGKSRSSGSCGLQNFDNVTGALVPVAGNADTELLRSPVPPPQ